VDTRGYKNNMRVPA